MFMVSCRKDFTSNFGFSDDSAYRNYTSPTDPSKFVDTDLNAILAAAKGKHVLVLVHGFNNPIENVLKSYWELVKGLQDAGLTPPDGYGLIVGFTWPGSRFGIGYFGARPKAIKSAPYLRDLVNAMKATAHSVDIQTHSLGARVALQALNDPRKTFIDNLLLTAAAVDNDLLEPDQRFFAATSSCNRLFSYHSKKDPVLGGAFWIGDVLDGIHPALGLKGPRSKDITLKKTPNVYVVDCSARVDSHGGYRHTSQYYDHWKLVLAGGPMNRYDELS